MIVGPHTWLITTGSSSTPSKIAVQREFFISAPNLMDLICEQLDSSALTKSIPNCSALWTWQQGPETILTDAKTPTCICLALLYIPPQTYAGKTFVLRIVVPKSPHWSLTLIITRQMPTRTCRSASVTIWKKLCSLTCFLVDSLSTLGAAQPSGCSSNPVIQTIQRSRMFTTVCIRRFGKCSSSKSAAGAKNLPM